MFPDHDSKEQESHLKILFLPLALNTVLAQSRHLVFIRCIDGCNLGGKSDPSLPFSGRALLSQNQAVDWGLEDLVLIFLGTIFLGTISPQEAGVFQGLFSLASWQKCLAQ